MHDDPDVFSFLKGQGPSLSLWELRRALAPLQDFQLQRKTTTWGIFDILGGLVVFFFCFDVVCFWCQKGTCVLMRRTICYGRLGSIEIIEQWKRPTVIFGNYLDDNFRTSKLSITMVIVSPLGQRSPSKWLINRGDPTVTTYDTLDDPASTSFWQFCWIPGNLTSQDFHEFMSRLFFPRHPVTPP